MEHPTLSNVERLIVDTVASSLAEQLNDLQPDRRAAVTLAVVVELAGETLRLVERDTERPPPPSEPTADKWAVPPAGSPCGLKLRRGGHVLHCKLRVGHAGTCLHD